jgi:hypothetical protein
VIENHPPDRTVFFGEHSTRHISSFIVLNHYSVLLQNPPAPSFPPSR